MDTRNSSVVSKNSNPTVTVNGITYTSITVEKYGHALNNDHRTFYFIITKRNEDGAPIELHARLKNMDNDTWSALSHFSKFFIGQNTGLIARIPEVEHCSTAAMREREDYYININLNTQLASALLRQQCCYIICLFQAMENSGHFYRRWDTTNITSRQKDRLGIVMSEFEKFFPSFRLTAASSTQTALTSLATNASQNQQANFLGIRDEHNKKVTVDGTVHNVVTTESYGATIKQGRRIFCFFMEKGDAYSGSRTLRAYIRSVDGSQWDRISGFNNFFNHNRAQLMLNISQLDGCSVSSVSNRHISHFCLKIVLSQTINADELKNQGKYIITLFQAMENSGYFPFYNNIGHRTNYEDRYGPTITEFKKLLQSYQSNEEKISPAMSSSSQTMSGDSLPTDDDSHDLTFAEYDRRHHKRKSSPTPTTETKYEYSEPSLIDSYHFEKKSEKSSANEFGLFPTTTLIDPAAGPVRKKPHLPSGSETFFEALNAPERGAAWENNDESAYAIHFAI